MIYLNKRVFKAKVGDSSPIDQLNGHMRNFFIE